MTIVQTNLVPDGLASAPGLAFEAEPDSGMYREATEQIGVAIAGAKVLGITEDGIDVGNIVEIAHTCLLNADCVDQIFFVANRAYEVVGVREVHATAGNHASAVTLQLERLQGTEAIGSGDALLTDNTNAGFDCKGTANTVQAGTLVETAAVELAAGNRLALNFTGDVQTLAGLCVTVQLKAI